MCRVYYTLYSSIVYATTRIQVLHMAQHTSSGCLVGLLVLSLRTMQAAQQVFCTGAFYCAHYLSASRTDIAGKPLISSYGELSYPLCSKVRIQIQPPSTKNIMSTAQTERSEPILARLTARCCLRTSQHASKLEEPPAYKAVPVDILVGEQSLKRRRRAPDRLE